MKKAVFLDRDGVINRAYISNNIPVPPKTIEELEILPGVMDAIKLLNARDFELIVVTNQPDVARGITTKESIELIHGTLEMELGINQFYTCYHEDSQRCSCRKPKPGLILKAASDLNLDLSSSFMVGDRWRDIAAGQSAECECFFINYGYKEQQPSQPFREANSLYHAALQIIEEIENAK